MRARPQHMEGNEAPKLAGGAHKDQMNTMFDKTGKKQQNAQEHLMTTLKENKQRYDRGLYSDWVIKVYQRCAYRCIKKGHTEGDYAAQLREVEKHCGRNCIRKYEKVYKLADALEPRIMQEYVKEQDIDEGEMLKELEMRTEHEMQDDLQSMAGMMDNKL